MTEADWPVRATVEITRDDYALLNQARNRLLTQRQRIFAIIRLAVFIAAVTYLVSVLTGQSWIEFAVFFGSFATIFAALAYRFTGRLNAWRYFKSYRVDKSPQTYEISPDGLRVSSSSFTGEFKWPAYHAIMRTPEHFLFWINPIQAHIVPFRVLGDHDVDRVWELLGSYPTARVEKVRP